MADLLFDPHWNRNQRWPADSRTPDIARPCTFGVPSGHPRWAIDSATRLVTHAARRPFVELGACRSRPPRPCINYRHVSGVLDSNA